MLFNAWFLYDGVLAGTRSAVIQALHLIEKFGPLGIFINLAKCELFSRIDVSRMIPAVVRVLTCHTLNYLVST